MKHTRLAFVLAITTLMATPVLAASMTMLQFGSFETREEAEKRLAEITSKHAAQVTTLPTSIREIKLPPDNLTVYRTQAGPVENRAAAQAICAQFASAGDECYIVQTAMLAPVAKAAVAAAPVVTDTSLAAAATAKTSPALSFLPKADAVPAPEVAADVTSKLATLRDLPARDPSNREALSRVSSVLTPAPEDTSITEPALMTALDKAVNEQDNVVRTIDNVAAAEGAARKPADRSFWSRLNPFSDDEPALEAPIAASAEPAAVPVEAVVATAVPTIEPLPAAALPVVAAKEPALMPDAPAPLVSDAAAPVVVSQPMAMRLPPPPAPLNARDRATLAAPSAPLPTGHIAAVDVAAPLAITATDQGSVNVEEAKRVPLTQSNIAAPVVLQAPPLQPPVSLLPSSTNGQKTIWAQVGPFADNAAALTFWANYRQTHPDFPVVRVRAVTPYQQQLRGHGESWLRVGPVLRAGFVGALCSSLPQGTTLRCGQVMDLGVAASPNATPGMLPGSRYKR